jgi:hypothetical protein
MLTWGLTPRLPGRAKLGEVSVVRQSNLNFINLSS